MQKNVIEMVIFETKDEVSEEQFIELFNALNKVLENEIEGFIKRTLTKDLVQNKWVEMIQWESMQMAQAALIKLPELGIFQKYCSVLKDEEMPMYHLVEKA